jgi:RNase adaptor protein for sRNA GlmZ degradation
MDEELFHSAMIDIMATQAQENNIRNLATRKILERSKEIEEEITKKFRQDITEDEYKTELGPLNAEHNALVERYNRIVNPHLYP